MKQLIAKLAVAGVGAVLLAGAASANIGNSHTGYESENDASVESENKVELDNDNDADIWNMINGMAKSGYNEAEENTGNGSVESGDAKGTVKITNTANNNVSDIDSCCSAALPNVTNDTTGAESENHAWVEMENKVEIDNDNDADVHNSVCVTADSGHNEASMNTGSGSVEAGDAVLDLSITNTLNSSDTTVD